MSVLVRGSRPKIRQQSRRQARPSVREVCLVSVVPTQPGWALGEQITWSGRDYQVAAQSAAESGGPDSRRYVYLSAPGAG